MQTVNNMYYRILFNMSTMDTFKQQDCFCNGKLYLEMCISKAYVIVAEMYPLQKALT
jgi:hypothetical protein